MNASPPDIPPRRVAVFRALMLGDLLCATPALRAMRAGWPDARITLVGLPWAGTLARRLGAVDDFEPFPGWPGLGETPAPAPEVACAFVRRMQAREFDLAIQLHGSGELTNALVASFGARHHAGLRGEAAWFPVEDERRFVDWPQAGHEILRLLALTDHLGLPRQGLRLDLPLHPGDHQRAHALVPGERPYAVVHPGAQLPSRRWPVQRFAEVADRLAAQGLRIVLTGARAEHGLVQAVASVMQHEALDLCGRTDLWTLGALVASAAVLVCNDTGLSHVAAARGTPSVVVACGSDVERWAPLDHQAHHVVWRDMSCRPCGYRHCPVGHGCAQGVAADTVAKLAEALAQGDVR